MSSPAYSTLKAAWHVDRIEALREVGFTAPVGLQLILSDLCNHDCHFCAYRASNGLSKEMFPGLDGNKNPNRMIAYDKACQIIDDAAALGVKSITFTGGGEPTVHPQHLDLFRRAQVLGMDTSLNTNGVVFREGWENVLPKMKYVRFSVDAGNAREYAEIRGTVEGHYKKALGNLSNLVRECENQGSDCVVGTGYVVTPHNFPNLIDGVKAIRKTGVSYVRLASMQSKIGRAAYNDKWTDAVQMAKEAENLATPTFYVVNLLESAMGQVPDYDLCGFQQMVVYVGADLRTYRCCYTAYTKLGESGSLENMSLREWFLDPDRRKRYEEFSARQCAICPLNDKNEMIAYLTQPDPLHVNFV